MSPRAQPVITAYQVLKHEFSYAYSYLCHVAGYLLLFCYYAIIIIIIIIIMLSFHARGFVLVGKKNNNNKETFQNAQLTD